METDRQRVSAMRIRIVLAAVTGAILVPAGPSLAQQKPAAKSLYQRLGGYDVIVAVVDDFLNQLRKDPAFDRFGGGRSQDSLLRTRQLVLDQTCFLTGGPCTYIGRDTKSAHTGLKITDKEWDSAMHMFKAALDDSKVAEPVQQDFLSMIGKLRPDIVEKPVEDRPKAQN